MSMKKILSIVLIAVTLQTVSAQKVITFFGDWHYWQNRDFIKNGIQYDYLTDVVLSFALPQVDGSLRVSGDFYTQLAALRDELHARGKKIHYSVGGYTATHELNGRLLNPDPFSVIVNDENKRAIFVAALLKIVEDYNLDGLNFDWEFPNASDLGALNETLLDIKLALLALEETLGKKLELSIAVSATDFNSKAYNFYSIATVDYVYVMAFDNISGHHSDFNFAKAAVDFWLDRKDVPAEKLVLGIPFYSRGAKGGAYKNFTGMTPSDYYNDLDGDLNGYAYNSRPLIQEKVAYLNSKGCAGVFVWELWDDRTDEYSLLRPLYYNTVSIANVPKEFEGLKIYPNPVVSDFYIDAPKELLNYSIYDLTGKLMQVGVLNKGVNAMNLSFNQKGVFFIKIHSLASEFTYKIVKTN